MLFDRLLAIFIIGGGFLIWNAIFKTYPLRKEYDEKPLLVWLIGFFIIIVQLVYIYFLFSGLLKYSDTIPFFFLVIIFAIIALIFLMLWRKYKR